FSSPDTATTATYTLSLHDALPICPRLDLARRLRVQFTLTVDRTAQRVDDPTDELRTDWYFEHARRTAHLVAFLQLQIVAENDGADRKSTRLNSSHVAISYAVFCLK